METELKTYRQHLLLAEQKAVEDFDKTVLSLSGGALGVSFAFLKDIVGPGPWSASLALFLAWLSWGLSVVAVLASYYFSHIALRHAIEEVDQGTIYLRKPGGVFARLTNVCNASGGLLFLVGVVLTAVFVYANMRR